MVGDPLEGGVGDEDVDPGAAGAAAQSRRSATSKAIRSSVARALAIISGLESRPRIAASGQRSASRAVRLPGPQPRSTTVRGSVAAIRAISSTNGRPRSSA